MPKDRNKSLNIIKTKNQPSKKPISIKKDQIKNNNSLFFNTLKNNNNKNNFNSTVNYFNKKPDINNNKTSIEHKNVSEDNLKVENKTINNGTNKKHSISLTTGHVMSPKIISNKSHNNKFKHKKNVKRKRGNFSPSVNRELLNKKQNAIFNYSTENRKNNNINNNNKTVDI